jgi:hypothetical protein
VEWLGEADREIVNSCTRDRRKEVEESRAAIRAAGALIAKG